MPFTLWCCFPITAVLMETSGVRGESSPSAFQGGAQLFFTGYLNMESQTTPSCTQMVHRSIFTLATTHPGEPPWNIHRNPHINLWARFTWAKKLFHFLPKYSVFFDNPPKKSIHFRGFRLRTPTFFFFFLEMSTQRERGVLLFQPRRRQNGGSSENTTWDNYFPAHLTRGWGRGQIRQGGEHFPVGGQEAALAFVCISATSLAESLHSAN